MTCAFRTLLILLLAVANPVAQNGVTLRGEILDKSILSSDARAVSVELKLRLTIRNNMDRPAILILEDDSVCDDVRLGLFSQSDPQARMYGPKGRPMYRDGAPRSYPGKEYVEKLRQELDVEPPPSAMTKVLAKDETIVFPKTMRFHVSKTANPSLGIESWSTLLSSSPLDMYLSCHTFSTNLDRGNEEGEFGRSLKARWESFGYLWLDGLKAAPIVFDLRALKTKSSR